MAKREMTRRAKLLHRQEMQEKAGHHLAMRKHNPDAVAAPGAQKARLGSSKDKSQSGRASTSVRGRTHDLSSSGRKTIARTQGGNRKGSGRDHAF